jgi:hypothetical protein
MPSKMNLCAAAAAPDIKTRNEKMTAQIKGDRFTMVIILII